MNHIMIGTANKVRFSLSTLENVRPVISIKSLTPTYLEL